ncbi:unnamed protein product, partial [Symbiodinium necroappetens]
AQFGAITSLLGEDEDEPEEQVPDKAQSSQVTKPVPDADGHRTDRDQDVAALAAVPGAQLPDEVPEASPAPSATSELVAGWSFE